MFRENTDTPVTRVSSRSAVNEPRIPSAPIASGRLAAVRLAEDHQQQDQQDGEGQAFGPGDAGGGLLVDRLVGRDHPADLGAQAGRAQAGLDRVVAVLPGGVAGAGQLDDGVGLVAAGADELPGPGRPVAGVRLGLAVRQRGQCAGHRGPERRRCGGEGLAGVQHHHVPGVAAERPRGQAGFVLALAVRGVEPAGGLDLGEDAGSPHAAEHRDEQGDQQDQPPPPVKRCGPTSRIWSGWRADS